jgi:hypothetical protein
LRNFIAQQNYVQLAAGAVIVWLQLTGWRGKGSSQAIGGGEHRTAGYLENRYAPAFDR